MYVRLCVCRPAASRGKAEASRSSSLLPAHNSNNNHPHPRLGHSPSRQRIVMYVSFSLSICLSRWWGPPMSIEDQSSLSLTPISLSLPLILSYVRVCVVCLSARHKSWKGGGNSGHKSSSRTQQQLPPPRPRLGPSPSRQRIVMYDTVFSLQLSGIRWW